MYVIYATGPAGNLVLKVAGYNARFFMIFVIFDGKSLTGSALELGLNSVVAK